ncbi:putative mitochondrial protein AtMg01250 [Bidens hawaiensis]|uniref:putative mitochondrial protein AtMg01250 n=1 Tax=Bidens hawaiensis TaxID=980011 RepID=UPI004049B7B6
MGFMDHWCLWIWGILMSARSLVLVSGSPAFEFQCSKVIRQGDPLSPFLFLTVMEALSCMIVKVCEVGLMTGLQLPNGGPTVSHLLYEDDVMIIGEWSEQNIRNVARILKCFRLSSGLQINFHKSSLYGGEVDGEEVNHMAEVLRCKPSSFPCKYLGIKVGVNMNRISNWDLIIRVFKE